MKKNRTFIIAEIGSVHDGSLGNAINLIEQAKICGADAVKFQTHLSEYETLKSAPRPTHFKNEGRYEYFKRTSFKFEEYIKLINSAKKNKILFLSSPFSVEAVDFLEKLKLKIYKVPSGEINNLPLLEKLKRTKKKILLSTGMSSFDEIRNAYNALDKKNTIIMQCTSMYPCSLENAGINVLKILKKKFNCSVGFSDHTNGSEAAITSVMLGAKVIEKHITFSKKMYGSDAKYSMDLEDFEKFCKNIRNTEILLNNPVDKDLMSKKLTHIRKIYMKSIVAKNDLIKDSTITLSDMSFLKPGKGISPEFYKKIIGKKIIRNIKKGTFLKLSDFK